MMTMTQPQQLQTLIKVSVAQLKCILADGNQSVTELTDSFIHIAGIIDGLQKTGNQQSLDIGDDLHALHQKVYQGIVAFQFFDRMSQRMEHVADTLDQIEQYQQNGGDDVSSLLTSLRASLTSESERLVFDQVVEGHSITEALESYLMFENQHTSKHDEDIELF